VDEKGADRCTIVVRGFQNQMETWWSEVVQGGSGGDGLKDWVEKIERG